MYSSICLIAGLALAQPALSRQLPERLLVVGAQEGALSILDPATGDLVAGVRLGPGPRTVAVSADGATAIVAHYGLAHGSQTISIVDVPAARVVRTIQTRLERKHLDGTLERKEFHRPTAAAFLPGGLEFVVTVETEGRLLFVDLASGAVRDAVDLGQEGPVGVLVDPEGRRAYVSNRASGSVSVVDLARRRLEKIIETGGGAGGMALSPERGELWVANSRTDSISVIDLETLAETSEFACGAEPWGLAFTLSGERLVCSNRRSGTLSVFTTESRKVITEVVLDRTADRAAIAPGSLVLAPGGATFYVACSGDDSIRMVDARSFKVTGRVTVGKEPVGLAWCPGEDAAVLAK